MKTLLTIVAVLIVTIVLVAVLVALFIGGMQLYAAYSWAGLAVVGLIILLMGTRFQPPKAS